MEREIMPDYRAEEFYRQLMPQNIFGGPEKTRMEANHCIVFCNKIGPNVFAISNGVAVVDGADNLFNDGACMIAPATKVVFVLEKTSKSAERL